MRCPSCGLVNPPESASCDCGLPLGGIPERPAFGFGAEPQPQGDLGKTRVLVGLAHLVFGVLCVVWSALSRSAGSQRYLGLGLILIGLWSIVRGMLTPRL